MPDSPTAPADPRRRARPVPCQVCTILIGEGYQETHPVRLPEDKGAVCWPCYESLRRQARKRASSPPGADDAQRVTAHSGRAT